jgi:hypothetical protein
MKHLILGVTLTIAVLGLSRGAQARCTDPRVETVRAQITSSCQCNGNHGQYVSCVAHAVRDAVSNGDLDVNCKGAVTKCAARSTCGKKSGFVTCTICEAGTCENGFCDDGTTACVDDSTCAQVVKRCSTKSSAEKCEARGGIVGTGSCCDAACVPGPSTSTVPTTSAPPTTGVPTTTTPTTSPPTTSTPTTSTSSTTAISPSGAFLD